MDDGDNHKDIWNISDERQFIENLLYQRVNFFIVFYSLILAGALSAHSQSHLKMVLVLGTIVSVLFTVSIYLLQHKLEALINIVRGDAHHPAAIVYEEIRKSKRKRWFTVLHEKGIDRKLIGYYVPGICSLSLLLGAYLSIVEVIKAAP